MPDRVQVPEGVADATLRVGAHDVRVTNLDKVFFAEAGLRKRDLLQYYLDVAPLLVPHVRDRPMVMKRYPNGATGEFFFMKRTPPGAPAWLRTCPVEHGSGNVIAFPVIDDGAALAWLANLGCIDLNPWYARCDDVDRPDVVNFDLDPVKDEADPVPFAVALEAALELKRALDELGMPSFPKTSGSHGLHVYVPIERGPVQKDVWRFAKALAQALAARRPDIITAEYKIAKRPAGRVLVDYNQNAWGRTLASIYSIRPTTLATVSTPLAWDEVTAGVRIEDFRVDNVRERFAAVGDLWAGVLAKDGRVDLTRFV